MARPSGLGRGLGALIPQELSGAHSALREVPLARIRPNQFQPRKQFDEEALASLVDSIKVIGVLQPVLLREVGGGDYELIAGERRCRAARRAGLQVIPALVQTVDDVSSLEQALVENLHREDLNPLDEAAAYKQLIEDFHLTHEEVARRVGRSRAAVSNALRLFQLPPAVQRLVREQKLSFGHARSLLSTPDRLLQEQLAERVVAEGLSVRALEQEVRASLRLLEQLEHELEGAASEVAGEGPVQPTGQGSGSTSLGGRSIGGTGALRPPGVLELEELLATHLNTRVRVEMGAKHGRLIIDFATLEDLERVYRLMLGGE